ncbi:MAG TPA: hypothetical protein VHA30_04245 [Patescibacteria group bacterium]|nr:hypothetical protein [Patescibacteria group bacterium]
MKRVMVALWTIFSTPALLQAPPETVKYFQLWGKLNIGQIVASRQFPAPAELLQSLQNSLRLWGDEADGNGLKLTVSWHIYRQGREVSAAEIGQADAVVAVAETSGVWAAAAMTRYQLDGHRSLDKGLLEQRYAKHLADRLANALLQVRIKQRATEQLQKPPRALSRGGFFKGLSGNLTPDLLAVRRIHHLVAHGFQLFS